jgi:hypothetical protein
MKMYEKEIRGKRRKEVSWSSWMVSRTLETRNPENVHTENRDDITNKIASNKISTRIENLEPAA